MYSLSKACNIYQKNSQSVVEIIIICSIMFTFIAFIACKNDTHTNSNNYTYPIHILEIGFGEDAIFDIW